MKSVSTLCAALVLLLTCLLSFSVEASQRSLRARSDKVLVSDGADGAHHSVSSKGVKANQKDDGDEAEDDDDDDDEDDDNEQDDEESDKGKAPVYKTKGSANHPKAAPSIISEKGEEDEDDLDEDDFNKILHPHAKEKAAMQKSIRKIEEELASNLKKQAELKSKLSFLLNHKESDAQIDTAAKQVANETESVAMATMLAKMWKEMRMFEVPVYAKHVEEERQQLKSEEKALEKKLREEQAKLVEARKKWAKDAKEKEQEQEGAKEKEHGSADAEVAKAEKKVQGAANQVAPAGDWEEYAGYQNFWRLNSQQQRTVLEGSIIYLLFGVLVAYLYHLGITKYPKAFSPSPKPAAIPHQTSFTFNLFGCFDDKVICALGCCCPCLRWAQTMDKANLLSYFKAFAAMYFLMLIHPYTAGLSAMGVVLLGAAYRQKLRRNYGIESRTTKTVCADVATWIFCQPCAVCQEAREEVVTRGRVSARGVV